MGGARANTYRIPNCGGEVDLINHFKDSVGTFNCESYKSSIL